MLCTPLLSFAQQSLSLSVTPTLFEVSAEPGRIWSSEVRVVNNNPYDITIYTDVVNFRAEGERGQAEFLPVDSETASGATLAEWVRVNDEPVTIPREQSITVPFSVLVPQEAPPGGHFAALLVGTQPPDGVGPFQVRTSQVVTTLLFMRVEGKIIEDGFIRSFTVDDSFVETPEADLSLRFENRGNVHLQPIGQIEVQNMWGKTRGVIPINARSQFGNVLPDSIREYNFSWTGESAWTDIGYYKAIVTLAYGEEARRFDSREVRFWVLPLTQLLLRLAILFAVLYAVMWSIRMYIRRVLYLSGVRPGLQMQPQRRELKLFSYRDLSRQPTRTPLGKQQPTRRMGFIAYLKANRFIFFSLGSLTALFIVVFSYFIGALTEERNYEVVIETVAEPTRLNSEEIIYDQLRAEAGLSNEMMVASATIPLIITNVSGEPGRGARVGIWLEADGNYTVASLRADLERIQNQTVILFDPASRVEALQLSDQLGGVLLSARPGEAKEVRPIELLIGQDIHDRELYTESDG